LVALNRLYIYNYANRSQTVAGERTPFTSCTRHTTARRACTSPATPRTASPCRRMT
jgi:hypothetical protein